MPWMMLSHGHFPTMFCHGQTYHIMAGWYNRKSTFASVSNVEKRLDGYHSGSLGVMITWHHKGPWSHSPILPCVNDDLPIHPVVWWWQFFCKWGLNITPSVDSITTNTTSISHFFTGVHNNVWLVDLSNAMTIVSCKSWMTLDTLAQYFPSASLMSVIFVVEAWSWFMALGFHRWKTSKGNQSKLVERQ